MTRILIFSTNYLPNIGGAEIAIKEITDRISNAEFEMIVPRFNRALKKREKVGNVLLHRIGIGIPVLDKLFIPLSGALKARSILKRRNIDVFWCMMVSFGSWAAYVYNILFFPKAVPIILTLQEGDSEEHIKERRVGMIAWSWRKMLGSIHTHHITVISEFLSDLARRYGYKGEISLVPNGVSVKRFTPDAHAKRIKDKEKIKEELGVREDTKVLITVSRLETKNAVKDIIASLSFLPKEVELLIIGAGSLKRELQGQARESGVLERVHFLGRIENEEIPRYLAAADVFVRPSLSEGQGIAFLEAMAVGVPVVATPVGGIPDFLEHEETGLFCEVKNPKSIAEQAQQLFENGALRERIIKRARAMVEERYRWSAIAFRMNSIFEKLTPRA